MHHLNKHLMGYFEFLHGSRIIFHPLNISEKLYWQHLFKKLAEVETHCLHFFKYDAIPTHPEKQQLSFKQTRTTTTFSFGYQSCTCPSSGSFCWKNPCSGCNSGIGLVVVLECTFFQLYSNTEQISYVHMIQKKLCKLSCCHSNQSYTAFLLDVRCSKYQRSVFLQLFVPNDSTFA